MRYNNGGNNGMAQLSQMVNMMNMFKQWERQEEQDRMLKDRTARMHGTADLSMANQGFAGSPEYSHPNIYNPEPSGEIQAPVKPLYPAPDLSIMGYGQQEPPFAGETRAPFPFGRGEAWDASNVKNAKDMEYQTRKAREEMLIYDTQKQHERDIKKYKEGDELKQYGKDLEQYGKDLEQYKEQRLGDVGKMSKVDYNELMPVSSMKKFEGTRAEVTAMAYGQFDEALATGKSKTINKGLRTLNAQLKQIAAKSYDTHTRLRMSDIIPFQEAGGGKRGKGGGKRIGFNIMYQPLDINAEPESRYMALPSDVSQDEIEALFLAKGMGRVLAMSKASPQGLGALQKTTSTVSTASALRKRAIEKAREAAKSDSRLRSIHPWLSDEYNYDVDKARRVIDELGYGEEIDTKQKEDGTLEFFLKVQRREGENSLFVIKHGRKYFLDPAQYARNKFFMDSEAHMVDKGLIRSRESFISDLRVPSGSKKRKDDSSKGRSYAQKKGLFGRESKVAGNERH